MSDPNANMQEEEEMPITKGTILRNLGIGAALVALPVGAFAVYNKLESSRQQKNPLQGNEASVDAMLRQVDPAMIKHREVLRIDTGFVSPTAIAIDGKGNLIVSAEGAVRRFSRTGEMLGTFPVKGNPYCLTTDEQGNTLVGFKDHIEVYSAEGKLASTWASFGGKSYLTCVTVSGNDVWVADAGRRVVVHCDREGKVLGEIGKADPGRGIPGLQVPSPHLDVAVAADGLIWVNNPGLHRLEAYKADGTLERYWGRPGVGIEAFPGCCNPADFALLKDGSFVTADKVVPRVKLYSPDGVLDSVVAPPAAFGQNMTGLDVATDDAGRIYVLERGAREVRVYVAKAGGTL